jgi:hypothetical protein
MTESQYYDDRFALAGPQRRRLIRGHTLDRGGRGSFPSFLVALRAKSFTSSVLDSSFGDVLSAG